MTSSRDILHVDMDAFFAAVEQHDHPELRGKPVIVGAPPDQRGVVSTCSYEARTFGVHSAMPSREAFRLCPQATFLPPDMPRYAAVSRQMFAIFERFTPLVEPVSIDEAFLDVTGSRRLFGEPEAIAIAIRAAIREETGLTASIGVAGNKFLAKLASESRKPDGLTVVPRDRAALLAFLEPLPVGRLWGVGKVMCELLENHGIRVIGDIQRASEASLATVVGRHAAGHLMRLAFGEDDRAVETDFEEKSLSREYTFPADCRESARLHVVLRDLVDDVGRRLRETGKYAGVARLKLRWSDFQTLTRQRSFALPVCDDFTLRRMALELLDAEPLVQPVRLIGFGVSGLAAERQEQMSFFDDPADRRVRDEKLCHTIDSLREKLGQDQIMRADVVGKRKEK
ncbi:MAG: DNA polymerase IV [Kiritimatiellia bacterium]